MQDHSTVIQPPPLSFAQKESYTKRNLAFVRELDYKMRKDINAGRRKLFNSVSPSQSREIQFSTSSRQNQVFFRQNGNSRLLQHQQSNQDFVNKPQKAAFSQIPEETDVLINKLIFELNQTKRERDVLRQQTASKENEETEVLEKANLKITQLQQIIQQNDFNARQALASIQQEKEQLRLQNQQMALTIEHASKTKSNQQNSQIVQKEICSRCESLEQRLRQIEDQLNGLNVKYERQYQKTEALSNQKTVFLAEFQQTLAKLESQLNSSQNQVANLSQEKKQLQGLINKLRNTQGVPFEKYDNLNLQYESLLQQHKKLENTYESLSFQHSQIVSQLNFVTQKIYEIHLQAGDAEKGEQTDLGYMISNLQAKFNEYREIINEKSINLQQLLSKLQEKEITLKRINVEFIEYRQKMQYDEEHYIGRIQELQVRDKQNKNVTAVNDDYEMKISDLVQKNQQLEEKVKELQVFINQSRQQLEMAHLQMAQQSEEHLIQNDKLISEMQATIQQAEQIRNKLEEAQQLLQQKDAAIHQVSSQLQQTEQFMKTVFTQQLEQQSNSIKQLLTTNQTLQNQNHQLKSATSKVTSLEEANKTIKAEIDYMIEENQKIANKNADLENILKEIQAENERILRERKVVQLQLLELRQHIDVKATEESPSKIHYNQEIANLQKQLQENWHQQQRMRDQNNQKYKDELILLQQTYSQKLKKADEDLIQRLQSEAKTRNQLEVQYKRKLAEKEASIASLSVSSEKYGEILIKYNTVNIDYQTLLVKNRQKEDNFQRRIAQLELQLENSRKQTLCRIAQIQELNAKLQLQYNQTYKNLQNAENYICQLLQKLKHFDSQAQQPATIINYDQSSVVEQMRSELTCRFNEEKEQMILNYQNEGIIKRNQILKYQQQLNEQLNIIHNKELEINQLRIQLQSKEQQQISLQSQSKMVSELIQEKNQLYAQYQRTANQNQQLKRTSEVESNRFKQKLEEKQTSQQQFFKSQIYAKQEQIQKLYNRLGDQFKKYQQLAKQYHILKDSFDQIRQQIAFKDHQITIHHQNVSSLQQERNSFFLLNQQLKDQNQTLKINLQHIQSQISSQIAFRDSQAQRNANLQQNTQKLETQLELQRQNLQNLRQILNSKEQELQKSKLKLKQFSQQSQKADSHQHLNRQLDQLRSELKQKQQMLNQLRGLNQYNQAKIQQAVAAQLNQFNQVKNQLQGQLQALTLRLNVQHIEIENQCNWRFREQINDLQNQRDNLLKDIQILSLEKAKKDVEISNLVQQCRHLEHELHLSDTQLATKTVEIQSIIVQLHELILKPVEKNIYEDRIRQLEKRSSSANLQFSKIQQQSRLKIVQIEQLKANNTQFQSQLRSKSQEISSLKLVIQQLQSNTKSVSRRIDRFGYKQGLNRVDQELLQSRRQLTGTQNHIKLLQEAITRAQQQIRFLNGYILDLQKKSEKSQSIIKSEDSPLKNMQSQKENQHLKSIVEDLTEANHTLSQKVSQLEVHILRLNQQISMPATKTNQKKADTVNEVQQRLLKQIEFFKSKLDEAESYIFYIEKHMREENPANEDLYPQNQKLIIKISQLENLVSQKDSLADSYKNKLSELSATIRVMEQQISVKYSKTTESESRISVLEKQNQRLSKMELQAAKEINQAKSKTAQLQKEIRTLQGTRKILLQNQKKGRQEQSKQVLALQESIQQLKSELRMQQSEIKESKFTIKGFQQKVIYLNEKISSIEQAQAYANRQFEAINSKLIDQVHKNNIIYQQLGEFKLKYSQKTAQLALLQQTVKHQVQILQQNQQNINSATQQIQFFKNKLGQAEEYIYQLENGSMIESKLQVQNQKVSQLQQQLDLLRIQLRNQSNTIISQLRQQIKESKESIRDLQTDKANITTKYNQSQSSFEAINSNLNKVVSQVETYTLEINRLKSEKLKIQETVYQTKNLLLNSEAELQFFKNKLTEAQEYIEYLQSLRSQQVNEPLTDIDSGEIDRLNEEIKGLVKKNQQLQNDKNKLIKSLKNKSEELQQITGVLQSYQLQLRQALAQIQFLEESKQRAAHKMSEYKQEIEKIGVQTAFFKDKLREAENYINYLDEEKAKDHTNINSIQPKAQATQLISIIDKLESSVAHLQAQKDELLTQLDIKIKQLQALDKQIHALKKERESLIERVTYSQNLLMENVEKFESLQSQLIEADQRLASIDAEPAYQTSQQKNIIINLKQRIQQLEGELALSYRIIDQLKSSVSQQEIYQSSPYSKTKLTKIPQEEEQFFQSKLLSVQSYVQVLQKQKKMLEDALSITEAKYNQNQAELQNLRRELLFLSSDKKVLESNIIELNRLNQDLKESLKIAEAKDYATIQLSQQNNILRADLLKVQVDSRIEIQSLTSKYQQLQHIYEEEKQKSYQNQQAKLRLNLQLEDNYSLIKNFEKKSQQHQQYIAKLKPIYRDNQDLVKPFTSLENFKQNTQKLQQRCKILETQLQQTQIQLYVNQNTNGSLKSQLQFVKNKLLSSQQLVSQLQKQLNKEQIPIFIDDKSRFLKDNIGYLQQKYRQIQIKLILSEQKERQYVQTIQTQQQNIHFFKESLNFVQKQMETLRLNQSSVTNTGNKHVDAHIDQVAFFKNKLAEAQDYISTLQIENNDLKEQLQPHENLVQQLQSITHKNQILHSQLFSMQNLKNKAQENYYRLQANFQELNGNINAKNEQINTFTQQVNRLQNLLNLQQLKYADEVGQLRRQIIQKGNRTEQFEQQNQKIQAQSQQREDKMQTFEGVSAQKASEYDQIQNSLFFKEKLFEAEAFIKELQEENNALKTDVADFTTQMQMLKYQIQKLKEKQVISQSKSIEVIKEEKSQNSYEVTFLKEKLFQAETYIIQLQKGVQKLTNQNIEKQALNEELQQNIQALQKQIVEGEQKNHLFQFEIEPTKQKVSLLDQTSEKIHVQTRTKKQEEQILELNLKLQSKQRELSEYRLNFTNENTILTQRLLQAQSYIIQLQQQTKELRQKVDNLNTTINHLQTQIKNSLQAVNQENYTDTVKIVLNGELSDLKEQNLQLREQAQKQHALLLAGTAATQQQRQKASMIFKQKDSASNSFSEQKVKINVELDLVKTQLQQKVRFLQQTIQVNKQLVSKNKQLLNKNSQLEEQIKVKELSLQDLSQSMRLKEGRLSQLQPIISQLESAQNQMIKLQTGNANYVNTTELLDQINRITDGNTALTEKLEDMSKIEEEQAALALSELNSLKQQFQVIKIQNSSLKGQLDVLRDQLSQKTHQLEHRTQVIALEHSTRLQLKEKIQLLQTQIRKLNAKIVSLQNIQKDFESFKASLKEKKASESQLVQSHIKAVELQSKIKSMFIEEQPTEIHVRQREIASNSNIELEDHNRLQLQQGNQSQQPIVTVNELQTLKMKIQEYQQQIGTLKQQLDQKDRMIKQQQAKIDNLMTMQLKQKEELLKQKEMIISQKQLQFEGKEQKIGSSIRKLIDITNNFHQEEGNNDPPEVMEELQSFPYLNELITSILYRLRLASAIQLQKSLKIQSLKAQLQNFKSQTQNSSQSSQLLKLNEKLKEQNESLKHSLQQLTKQHQKLRTAQFKSQPLQQQLHTQKYAQLLQSIATLESENAQLKKQIADFQELGLDNDRYDELLKQCADYQIHNNELEEQLKGITDAHERQKQKIRQYEEQIQNLLSSSQNRDLYQQNLSLKQKLTQSQKLFSSIKEQDSSGSINTQQQFKLQFLHLCLNKVDQIQHEVKRVESEIENLAQRQATYNLASSIENNKPEDSNLMQRLQELEEQLLRNAENIRQHHQQSDGELYILLKELVNDEEIPAKSKEKIQDYLAQLQEQILREYQEHQNEVRNLKEQIIRSSEEKDGQLSDGSKDNLLREIQNLNGAVQIYHQESMRRKKTNKKVLQTLLSDMQCFNQKYQSQESLQIARKIELAIERNEQEDLMLEGQDFVITGGSGNVQLLGEGLQQKQNEERSIDKRCRQTEAYNKPFLKYLLSAQDIDKEDLELLKKKIAELRQCEVQQNLKILKSKERRLEEALQSANKEVSAHQIQNIMVTLANNLSSEQIAQILKSEDNDELINKLNQALSLQQSFYRGLNSSVMMQQIQQRKKKYYEKPTKLSEQVFKHLLGMLSAKKDDEFYEQVDTLFRSMYEIQDGFELSFKKKDEVYRSHNERVNHIFNRSQEENSEDYLAELERGNAQEMQMGSQRKVHHQFEGRDFWESPQKE